MKHTVVMLAMLALLGLPLGILKAQEEKPAPKTLEGTVVKVDDKGVVTVKSGEKEINVATDKNTVVTIDGEKAKVADLKAGMTVVVTPAEGIATKIEAKSPPEPAEAEDED